MESNQQTKCEKLTAVELMKRFSCGQGRNEGGKGPQCPGLRISVGVEKSQQCRKYFLHYSTFTSERLRFEHGGAKLVSCPGRHLTSIRPCMRQRWFRFTTCARFSFQIWSYNFRVNKNDYYSMYSVYFRMLFYGSLWLRTSFLFHSIQCCHSVMKKNPRFYLKKSRK